MYEELPAVIHLAIHLPGEQPVYFADNSDIETICNNMEAARTTLMAFFQYNADNLNGRLYLYQEFPIYFTYNKTSRKWTKRKQGIAIGRMYHCNPFMGEKYYLRLLLTCVRGPQSFQHLRTVNEHIYPTFQSACQALGLLADDNEWVQCFTEAIVFASGCALRTLFCTALIYGNVIDPLALWNAFVNHICDDLKHYLNTHTEIITAQDIPNYYIDYGLYLIATTLHSYNKHLDDYQLPLFLGQ